MMLPSILRSTPLLVLLLVLLISVVDAGPGSPSSAAVRKFLPNVPNGLLRSVAALNKRPVTDTSQMREVAAVKKKRPKPVIQRPSNEQVYKQLSKVGFFYGMTPMVVEKSTSRTPSTTSKKVRKKRLALRDTMRETLDEVRSLRQELEELRREMKQIISGGMEPTDEKGAGEGGVSAVLARRKRQAEFESIGKEVEKWAEDLLFRQNGEVEGWTEVKCNKVFQPTFQDRTSCFIKWMKDSRGSHASSDDERQYPCIKVYSTIEAPLEEVCSYLSQEKHLSEYNDLVTTHRDLEELSPNAKICLGKTPQLLFVKPRTFVTYCNHRWLRDGTQVVVNQACEYEGAEATAFALRGASYIGRDPDDPEKTRVSLLAHTNPGSDVPDWAAKTALKALMPIEPFKLFHKINECVKRARSELQPDLNDTEMVGMPGRISRPAGLGQMGFACFWPNGGGVKEGLASDNKNRETLQNGVPGEVTLPTQDDCDEN